MEEILASVQVRRDTKANWETINPILLEGEAAYEQDTDMFKIGDGIKHYSDLPYHNKVGPQGPQGEPGPTPQISMNVSTGNPGTSASVSVTGTAENPVINLTVPRGDTGKTGSTGPKGDTGNSGVYIGTSQPTDSNINVWIDSDGEPTEVIDDFAREAIGQLKGDLDTLNQGGLNLKEDFIGKQVNEWLDGHPEATTTVQDDSLTYKKFVKGTLGYVTPEMFGAVGDGITNDTTAIIRAVNFGLPIILGNKEYYVTELILSNCVIIGNKDLSILKVSNVIYCKEKVLLKNFCVDVTNKIQEIGTINTVKSSNNIILDGIHFIGTTDKGEMIRLSNDVLSGFSDDSVANRNVIIKNCVFEDTGIATIMAYGIQHDIYILKCNFKDKESVKNHISMAGLSDGENIIIKDCFFGKYLRMAIEIFNVDKLVIDGNEFSEDMNTESFLYSISLPGCTNVHIVNNIGTNCSGFEFGERGENGCSNTYIINNRFVFKKGSMSFNCENVKSENIIIKNNYFEHKSAGVRGYGYAGGSSYGNVGRVILSHNTIVNAETIVVGDYESEISYNNIIRTSYKGNNVILVIGKNNKVIGNIISCSSIGIEYSIIENSKPIGISIDGNQSDIIIADNTIDGGDILWGHIGTWASVFENSPIIIGNKLIGILEDKRCYAILLPSISKFANNIVTNSLATIAPNRAADRI